MSSETCALHVTRVVYRIHCTALTLRTLILTHIQPSIRRVADTESNIAMSSRSTRRVLIYKRTHIGDPNSQGDFGCHDCMGRIRGYTYDAVIGIGGSSCEPRSQGIDGRITWVGVGPHQWPPIHPRGA